MRRKLRKRDFFKVRAFLLGSVKKWILVKGYIGLPILFKREKKRLILGIFLLATVLAMDVSLWPYLTKGILNLMRGKAFE